jgi:hypothetical protein
MELSGIVAMVSGADDYALSDKRTVDGAHGS